MLAEKKKKRKRPPSKVDLLHLLTLTFSFDMREIWWKSCVRKYCNVGGPVSFMFPRKHDLDEHQNHLRSPSAGWWRPPPRCPAAAACSPSARSPPGASPMCLARWRQWREDVLSLVQLGWGWFPSWSPLWPFVGTQENLQQGRCTVHLGSFDFVCQQ